MRALLSVSDKTQLVEFAKQLHELSIDILSTGGTAKLLKEHNIPVTEVSDYTGFPEIMGGRVKTLHPKIHAGLLARRGQDDAILNKLNIDPIDIVTVNLYPFKAKPTIENIDIGGPTMLRAAAKNYQHVTAVVDPADYQTVINEIKAHGSTSEQTRFYLAQKVFTHTAGYDAAISNHLDPNAFNLQLGKKQSLRYGENPHQRATFYVEENVTGACIANVKQLQGKELSYNNIADTDAALECVKSFDEPACVVLKHANPCGVATADNLTDAYQRAFAADPVSAFGGIIACNCAIDEETAKAIVDNQFAEVIIAPNVDKKALELFSTKKNLRVLICEDWQPNKTYWDYKRVNGGLLVQEADITSVTAEQLNCVTQKKLTEQQIKDALFAWKVVKFVKSNAVVYAKNGSTVGIGAGQMSRVFSCKIAELKAQDAGLSLQDSVMASDAFFPFSDAVDVAAKAGVKAIIQPGGSIRDEEVIQAANEAKIAMVFTGMRHFKH